MEKIIVTAEEFPQATARVAANEIRTLQRNPAKQVVIVFATGNTMVGFLDNLSRQEDIDWQRIQAFHLDEYKGLSADSPYSFAYFLDHNLFSKVPLPEKNIHYVDGTRAKENLPKYIEELWSYGGADIVILGIGMDGHLAFNEPPKYSSFLSRIQEVSLEESTLVANEPDYPEIRNNPHAYTMGMADIFEGRHLFFFANGKKKAEIVRKSLQGPVTEEVPASMLQKYPKVTVVLDEGAATCLNPKHKEELRELIIEKREKLESKEKFYREYQGQAQEYAKTCRERGCPLTLDEDADYGIMFTAIGHTLATLESEIKELEKQLACQE